jgi:hypothetical protein
VEPQRVLVAIRAALDGDDHVQALVAQLPVQAAEVVEAGGTLGVARVERDR